MTVKINKPTDIITRREGHFVVWYAACVECKRKEESQ